MQPELMSCNDTAAKPHLIGCYSICSHFPFWKGNINRSSPWANEEELHTKQMGKLKICQGVFNGISALSEQHALCAIVLHVQREERSLEYIRESSQANHVCYWERVRLKSLN